MPLSPAAHTHTGTLLILDVLNAASFHGEKKIGEGGWSGMRSPHFSAAAVSMRNSDISRQLIVRHRIWNIPGQPPVEDSCQYKSFYPAEIKHLLTEKGFRVVGMFDNMELRDTDLSGLKLYVASIMLL